MLSVVPLEKVVRMDGREKACFLQHLQDMETLLGILGDCCGYERPGVICYLY